MLRIRWINLVLVCLLAAAPLESAFAQSPMTHAAMMHAVKDSAQDMHTGHEHLAASTQEQQSDQPCSQHKGPCLACGLCGAHCATLPMRYELSPLIGHYAIIVAPPLLAAIPAPPPPGKPPRTLRS